MWGQTCSVHSRTHGERGTNTPFHTKTGTWKLTSVPPKSTFYKSFLECEMPVRNGISDSHYLESYLLNVWPSITVIELFCLIRRPDAKLTTNKFPLWLKSIAKLYLHCTFIQFFKFFPTFIYLVCFNNGFYDPLDFQAWKISIANILW